MSWNKDVAISYLRSHALGHSHSECAKFTRLAILAGGVKVSNLISGDVAVIQPYPGENGIGHMTMYDGTRWISDFVQKSMYPGPGYRKMQPSFKIYRMH